MGPRDKGALSVAAGKLRDVRKSIDDPNSPADAIVRVLIAELSELSKSGDEARLQEIINHLVDTQNRDR